MNKQCKACGANVPNEARFCQKCGASDFMMFEPEQTNVLDSTYVQYNIPPVASSNNQYDTIPPAVNQNTQYQNIQYQNYQQAPEIQQNWQTPVQPIQPKKKKTGLIIGIVAAVVLVLAGIGSLAEKAFQNQGYEEPYDDYDYNMDDTYDDYETVEYTKGYFDGTTYINEWADIKFDIPDGFVEGDDTMYASAETATADCGIYFVAEDAMSLIYICFEGLPAVPAYDEESYLDVAMPTLESQTEIIYQTPDTYKIVDIAGNNYTAADCNFKNGYYEGVQSFYVRKIDDRMVFICATGVSVEENEALVNMITSAN